MMGGGKEGIFWHEADAGWAAEGFARGVRPEGAGTGRTPEDGRHGWYRRSGTEGWPREEPDRGTVPERGWPRAGCRPGAVGLDDPYDVGGKGSGEGRHGSWLLLSIEALLLLHEKARCRW